MPQGAELILGDQPLERLFHEFVTRFYVVKNAFAEDEMASINPQPGRIYGSDTINDIRIVFDINCMKALRCTSGQQTRDRFFTFEDLDKVGQMQVAQAVAVIREKNGIILDMLPDCQQALADI